MNTENLDYTSNRTFSLKQKAILTIAPPLGAAIIKGIDATCKHVERGRDNLDTVSQNGNHFIAAIWHENLIPFLCEKRNSGFYTLTSNSFDGELAARVVNQFGLNALRGSSSQGGMKALSQMAIAIRETQMVGWTLDGPKGPRRKAKPGMAMLALRTQLPILPMAATSTRSYRLHSWDRLVIPTFFSTVAISFGKPIAPPADKTKQSILETTEAIETAMNMLQNELEKEFNVDPELNDRMST